MNEIRYSIILLLAWLGACEEQPLQAVGQLESDRVELVAESTEPIIAIPVLEGDTLTKGTIVIRQDASRLDIRIREVQANIVRIQAILDEQISGPRPETIDAAKANLRETVIERDFRSRDLDRLAGLRAQNLTSIESVDTAQKLFDLAEARIEFATARLAELEAGTRKEQIDQTRGLLQQVQAQLDSLDFDRERLFVMAPVAAIVDSLPFEIGERPRQGDVVAVLLTGDQPYARLYIPESVRVGINIGTPIRLQIDGLDQPLTGTVRRIAAEPSFTPYFALTERDRGRLSYVAEVTLPEMPTRLPEGMPVQADFE